MLGSKGTADGGSMVSLAISIGGELDMKAPVFQLTEWDPFTSTFIILDDARILALPFFTHRGVSLDRARKFIPLTTIKEMLDSTSFSKMNVFHWHITDSQSFSL